MKRIIILITLMTIWIDVSGQQNDKISLNENLYDVGFRYYKEYDTTRIYTYNQDTIYRPMLIHFWYPSKVKSKKDRMKYKQYIDLISIREDFSKPKDIIDRDSYNFLNAYAQFAQQTYGIGNNIGTQQILESPVKACLNLPIPKDEFPLIIYAPSNGKSPIQNHVICEYLASQGYYVVSLSSLNKLQRNEFEKSVFAQVEDMEFILNYIEKQLNINYTNVGLLGFSSGGLATSIFQMNHSNTKAVFSMDGSHEYSLFLNLSKCKVFDLDNTAIPYFLVANQNKNAIYPYFNSIKSNNKFFFRMPYLDHFGFVSFWTYFDNCNPDTSKHNHTLSYQFICESALTFFDAILSENKKSCDKLSSLRLQQNKYALHENLDYSESIKLLNEFLEEDIDSAISIYKNNKATNFNNYNYNEEEISALASLLLDYDIDASIKLFLFNQEEYPDSWHAYFDLAYSYKLKGEKDLAKIALLKAQEIDPDNKEVKGLLEELDKEE